VEYVRVPSPALRPPPESADRPFHPLINLFRTSPKRVGPFLKLLEISPDLLYVHGTINLGFLLARAAHVFPTILDAHGSVATDNPIHSAPGPKSATSLAESYAVRTANGTVAASMEL